MTDHNLVISRLDLKKQWNRRKSKGDRNLNEMRMTAGR